mgnify:CR=1 FL=1
MHVASAGWQLAASKPFCDWLLVHLLLPALPGRWQAALREADAAQQAERVEQLRSEMSAAAGAAAQVGFTCTCDACTPAWVLHHD